MALPGPVQDPALLPEQGCGQRQGHAPASTRVKPRQRPSHTHAARPTMNPKGRAGLQGDLDDSANLCSDHYPGVDLHRNTHANLKLCALSPANPDVKAHRNIYSALRSSTTT
ncbi:hypothetical protein CGRA01v4_09666 [Colletotrichum graminicola]|uniref:Uncharacterized protein n=1 Tax=Colletotrichum graminicola (strain M1.001 / M2 / FGSC 10212) TaxID=645133 RepID=E3QNU2_COLGM|nr:uncharacterized protein GLRG_07544 [Colletotrichum graminicola M1.001]EFQ32530.1 hypothetical protein GLRG_07544 [Colletotrichum graminicola M1.001]WDK18381.1 hypothetical protein CGRA01v4_09666 [Colletotrichum graminicola]